MRSRRLVRAVLVVAACPLAARSAHAQVPDHPVTGYVTVPTVHEDLVRYQEEAPMTHPGATWIIYLNRNGGRYDPGWPDDSQTNRSSVLSFTLGSGADIPAYSFGDASWQQVLDCVRDLYADFDVYITDEDPGDTPHMETVVGGSPGTIGLPPGVGGIAPSGCEPIPNSVQYVFPDTYGPGMEQGICEATGQETAHSFGLDHEYWCPDVMTYLFDCGVAKTFVDEDHPCGEYGPRDCSCGSPTQNSYQWLLTYAGAHPLVQPPTVSITSPGDGDTVAAGFQVSVDATDDGTIVGMDLVIDGATEDSATSPPWQLDAPGDLADGDHEVVARATDDDGETATDTIHVTVTSIPGDECGPLQPCGPGQSCVDGRCQDSGGGDADADGASLGDGRVGFNGGGCAVARGEPEPGLFLVGLAIALASRRRRQ
jgi:Big-like domain-containing protein